VAEASSRTAARSSLGIKPGICCACLLAASILLSACGDVGDGAGGAVRAGAAGQPLTMLQTIYWMETHARFRSNMHLIPRRKFMSYLILSSVSLKPLLSIGYLLAR
jgi:hypothetical protein